MKIKQTLFAIIVLLGSILLPMAVPSSAYAASCDGTETAIIQCNQSGTCKGGENPYEGENPGQSDADQTAYFLTHKHSYGKCADGSEPFKKVTDTAVWQILIIAINILTAGVGILAVGGVVYGSILYTSAGGSAEQIKKATTVFTNVVIGVVAYAAMYAFLNFIIPGGIFN